MLLLMVVIVLLLLLMKITMMAVVGLLGEMSTRTCYSWAVTARTNSCPAE